MQIYKESELKKKIHHLIGDFENETVEFKEAKTNYSFKDIGKYFSALSNEANLRGLSEGWLIFGITNNGSFCGSNYRLDGGLQNLKKEIADRTNERQTFFEIYEIKIDGKRVIAFQIPPAIRGIPTLFNGAAYARENEATCPLPYNKIEEINRQKGYDWSAQIIEDAKFSDLDPQAIKYARELFIRKQVNKDSSLYEILDGLSDVALLNKAGILIDGKVTNTALLLLGKSESKHLFQDTAPKITWTLYNADGSVNAYEHFDIPMLLAVDSVYAKIRNERYRYIAGQQTLFPEETYQYDPDAIKELINNCIVHSDYRYHGRINVEEFENRLVFLNEGSFIPESIENVLEAGYKPPYYRNAFLSDAMVNLYMIDTISLGIQKIYKLQRDKYFPLPTYDLNDPQRVKVTIFGKILDPNYTRLLQANTALNLRTVFLLDKVQKKETITRTECDELRKQHLIEGRYPNIYVSFKVAKIVDRQDDYIRTKGLDDQMYENFIYEALKAAPGSKKDFILRTVIKYLPEVLDEQQKRKKVSNLLQKMRKEGKVVSDGYGRACKWYIKGNELDNEGK